MRKTAKWLMILVLLCTMLATCVPPALAAEAIDPDRDVQFTIAYQKDFAIEGARFDLYRVADMDPYTNLTLTGAFANYQLRLSGLQQEEWDDLAITLKGYVWADAVQPDFSGVTDETGKMVVTVKPGLYLAVGYRRTIGEYTYSPTPFLVFLPGWNETANTWDYEVTSYPKHSKETFPGDNPDDKYITRKVLKIWDDQGKESSRPQEITVHLMCDGSIYETVKLSAANNWRYAWDNLEWNHDYLVTEDAVSGYTQKVSQVGVTFTITNKTKSTEKDPDTPTDETLPQTGQPWGSVIFFSLLGVLLLVIGFFCRKKGRAGRRKIIYLSLSILAICAALSLTGNNFWTDHQAKNASQRAAARLVETISQRQAASVAFTDFGVSGQVPYAEIEYPDYVLNPSMEMPKEEIDGLEYVGILEIPSRDLQLPIQSDWSYPQLKKTPCRYEGSAYLDNLVICAHNYDSHFGCLKELEKGERIIFTDVDGNAFVYQVEKTETLEPNAVEEMTSGEWDLTLFTCTIGGAKRVTLRCNRCQ